MAVNSLHCSEVPVRNCSLTYCLFHVSVLLDVGDSTDTLELVADSLEYEAPAPHMMGMN